MGRGKTAASMVSLVRPLAIIVIFGLLSPLLAADAASGNGWGTAEPVENGDSGTARYPQLSVDREGNAIVVYEQFDGVRVNISSSRYEVGKGWGTPQLVETDDTGDATNPQVSTDGSGNAIAVWIQSSQIWSNRYVLGDGWGDAQLIEANDSAHSYEPQVAMNVYGNAVAVWIESSKILSNRYAVGLGWENVVPIGNSTRYALNPQVAMDASGNAIVLWDTIEDYGPGQIWANRYVEGRGWGVQECIQANNSKESAYLPQVSMDDSGNAVAVWTQSRDVYLDDVWSNRYVAGSGWGTAELIETDSSLSAAYPEVSMNGAGNATAVWRLYDNNDPRSSAIWSNRYTVGVGWAVEELIQTNVSGGFAFECQVAMDRSGNAVAVWVQKNNDSAYRVWSNRFVTGLGWAEAQIIETTPSGDAQSPQVSVDDSGNAIAVWLQSPQLWSNRYTLTNKAPPQTTDDISPLVISSVVIIAAVVLVVIMLLVYRRKKETL